MVLSIDDLKKCLEILEINSTNTDQVTLKQASKALQRLALSVHPDKVGEEFTADFQRLRDAYEKIRDHLKVTEN